jgi:hypothetical protein
MVCSQRKNFLHVLFIFLVVQKHYHRKSKKEVEMRMSKKKEEVQALLLC